jgi:hypothetical protein
MQVVERWSHTEDRAVERRGHENSGAEQVLARRVAMERTVQEVLLSQ